VALSRRKFIKLSAAASAAAAVGLGVKSPQAMAFNASIAQLISIDPVTLSYAVYGPCCYWCQDYLIVTHYQPVALIEVIKGGGDSVMGNTIGSILSAGRDDNSYTSMQVRIWELPEWAIDIAMAYQSCKLCGVDMARTENQTSQSMTDFCGAAANTVISKATEQFNESMPDCFPKLIYSTEMDPTWNTGCRDLSIATGLGLLECNTFTSSFNLFGQERCIGQWGPLYPRQMASHDDNAAIAAGIAAYRAIHVSGFAIGSFPFNAALSVGKLQQTAPHVTVGFQAGSLALDLAMRAYPVSLAEIYAFVWWAPVGCCKTYDEVMGMCEPNMTCQ
jgi:hypothetical protein